MIGIEKRGQAAKGEERAWREKGSVGPGELPGKKRSRAAILRSKIEHEGVYEASMPLVSSPRADVHDQPAIKSAN